MIRKIVLPLFVLFAMVLAACAPAVSQSTEVAVKPTQPPAQEPTVVVPTLVSKQEPTTEAQSEMMSMLDTIKADDRLGLFYEALTLSGVVDILKGKGPFTVFAPTDDAIKAVPNLNSMEEYGKIIENHIVLGKFMEADLIPSSGKLMNITIPESGEPIVISVEDGVMHLHTTNDANGNSANAMVITADIETANGVLHVIDAMLLLPTK